MSEMMICPDKECFKATGCYNGEPHKKEKTCRIVNEVTNCPACVPYEPEKINIDSIEARKLMAKTVEDFEKANKPEYTLALIPNDIIVEVRYPHNATCYDCQHKFKVINPEKLAEKLVGVHYTIALLRPTSKDYLNAFLGAIYEYMESIDAQNKE